MFATHCTDVGCTTGAAHGLDEALDVMTLDGKVDKHPEKRMKAVRVHIRLMDGWMCIYIYIYIYIYMYIYIYVHTRTHARAHTSMSVCVQYLERSA